jgi:hypothetical protein
MPVLMVLISQWIFTEPIEAVFRRCRAALQTTGVNWPRTGRTEPQRGRREDLARRAGQQTGNPQRAALRMMQDKQHQRVLDHAAWSSTFFRRRFIHDSLQTIGPWRGIGDFYKPLGQSNRFLQMFGNKFAKKGSGCIG